MKQYISLVFICAITILNSCNLDIVPADEIAGEDAIDNVATARDAINSAYLLYPKSNMTFSILAEDFFPTYLISRNEDLNLLYKWDAQQIKLESNNLWRTYYSTIRSINSLLASEKYIKINKEAELQEWNKIKGEAYALKAMAYFDLLNIYSLIEDKTEPGIVLKDKIELEYLPRSSTEACLIEIKRLLNEASILLIANAAEEKRILTKSQYYLGYYASTLMSAKVALSEQDYASAKKYCEIIITDIGYKNNKADATAYYNLWTNEDTEEKLFSFDNQTFILSGYIDNIQNGDYFAIPSSFDYEENDVRKGIASIEFEMKANGYAELVKRNLIGKYRTGVTDYSPKNINWLRLPEAYFILSECYAESNNLEKAISTINIFLSKRGVTQISRNIDKPTFLKKLFFEKQKEFHGEGLNFFEMKRLRKDIKRYKLEDESTQSTILKNDYRMLFPIPLTELKNNPNMTQNIGWDNIVK